MTPDEKPVALGGVSALCSVEEQRTTIQELEQKAVQLGDSCCLMSVRCVVGSASVPFPLGFGHRAVERQGKRTRMVSCANGHDTVSRRSSINAACRRPVRHRHIRRSRR